MYVLLTTKYHEAHKKNVFKLSLFKRLGQFYCYLNTRVAFPNPNKVLKKYNSDFTSKSF